MDMMIPQLVYAKDPKSDAVALSVSLVPTFDEVQPQDFYEAVQDERPEQTILSGGESFHFSFIIDRSGSMGISGGGGFGFGFD